MTSRRKILIIFLGVAFVSATTILAFATFIYFFPELVPKQVHGMIQEEEIPYSSLPTAVREAAEKAFGGSDNLVAEREVQNGQSFYEIMGIRNGKDTAYTFTDDGRIMEFQKSINFEELPLAVRQQLRSQYPDARFGKVQAVELNYYEVEVIAGKKKFEVRVLPTGEF